MIKLKDILRENDTKNRGGVLYRWNEKYLLCKGESSGKWNIPKGHFKKGETPLQGSVREFTEETQIILNKEIKLSHVAKKSKGGDYHIFICQGDKKFVPRIGHEHMAWGYYNIMSLPQPFDERITPIMDKLYEASQTANIKGLKGATGFIKPEEWPAKLRSLKKSITDTTRYLLLERVDLMDTAKQFV